MDQLFQIFKKLTIPRLLCEGPGGGARRHVGVVVEDGGVGPPVDVECDVEVRAACLEYRVRQNILRQMFSLSMDSQPSTTWTYMALSNV